MFGDENFEDSNAFVKTIGDKNFIPINRIQVVSNRQKYGNSDNFYVEVRYQDGDEYPTARVDENELLRKTADAADCITPAAPGTYCVYYDEEKDVLRRWPIIAWRFLDQWTQPRPVMLDAVSFDPLVERFTILLPDGIVFQTENEKWWGSLEEYKAEQRKANYELKHMEEDGAEA
jgi:hypothetical protein